MGVWARPAAVEKRDNVRLPAYLAQGGQSGYGAVNVTPDTALQAVAVRSAVDLIASLSSELPVDVFSGTGADRKQRTTPGHLLDPSGDGMGLQDWAYQVITSWLLRGNLFGDVLHRSPAGYPTQVSIHHPDSVSPSLDADGVVQWRIGGRLLDDPDRMLHRRVNPMPGVVLGLSPIALHAATVGVSLTSTQFGLQWFKDGAHPSGILKNSKVEMTEKLADNAKQWFLAKVRGSREPAVMGEGWEFEGIQIAPEESQFLGTQGMSAAECARIFGPGMAEILGYESGGALTYANVESRLSHLLTLSLNKWFTRLERLLTEMLPRPQYVRINRDALLQSTTLDRYKAHELALRNRWKVTNEVRSDEDMPPVQWGDEPNPVPGAANETTEDGK